VIALFFLAWVALEATNPWVLQDWGNKSTCVELTMTKLAKVWIPSCEHNVNSSTRGIECDWKKCT
jgi:hypothetical protein